MREFNIFTPEAGMIGGSAVMGGLLLKLIEKFWVVRKNIIYEHSHLRKELREELDIVKDDLATLRQEVDEWREKYYSQVETTNELLFEVSVLKSRLRKYEVDAGELLPNDHY
jgi:uncharacterized coiled-coil DUF342 family protein